MRYAPNPKTWMFLVSSCLVVVFAQSIEARCSVTNEDVVGAVRTGDAPTTSEWSTISLLTNVWLISEVSWQLNTETKMSSFWRNFNHWLHWKLSFWQLPVQPVMKISSKWRHSRFSEIEGVSSPGIYCHWLDLSSFQFLESFLVTNDNLSMGFNKNWNSHFFSAIWCWFFVQVWSELLL